MTKTIYMDNSAASRLRPEVLDAMKPVMLDQYGNASSLHHKGREARKILEDARARIAAFIGADSPQEIIFTSGGTEADNLALKGTLAANKKKGAHIITSAVEHHAVLYVCKNLERDACVVTYVPVDEVGLIKLDDLKSAIRDDTVIVSIMHANNEVGVIQPLKEISEICRERGVTFHSDCVQSVGKVPVNVNDLGVDLLSMSAHKFHGPKGVGALYIRKGVRIKKQSFGGHHERNLRAGTENVPGVVGMAAALEIAVREMDERNRRLAALRDRLEAGIAERVPEIRMNGDRDNRLPHIANIGFKYIEGEGIILSLDDKGICVSSGSACTSDTLEASHVLTAMCVPVEEAHGSIRFSLGDDLEQTDIEFTIDAVTDVVERLRRMSPLYNKK